MSSEAVTTSEKIEDLYELIDGIEIAMLTTRRGDGHLVSRAMANQKRIPGADLWFVTDAQTHKLEELAADSHVNVAYYKDRTKEWVSVSGTATLSRDPEEIRALWAPDWKIWFPDEGPGRDGGPTDSRMVLIKIKAHSALYMVATKPAPIMLFGFVKAMIKGEEPDLGEMRKVSGSELHGANR